MIHGDDAHDDTFRENSDAGAPLGFLAGVAGEHFPEVAAHFVLAMQQALTQAARGEHGRGAHAGINLTGVVLVGVRGHPVRRALRDGDLVDGEVVELAEAVLQAA